MKLQSKTLLAPVDAKTLQGLTTIVDEKLATARASKGNTFSAAQYARIVKGRRVFTTRRFIQA